MSAYIIGRIEADQPELLKPYQASTPAIIKKYGGKFISRGGAVTTLEGPVESRRIVMVEFPTFSDAEAFFASVEYTEARKLREGIGAFELIIVDGID